MSVSNIVTFSSSTSKDRVVVERVINRLAEVS
jgi:hypothetical protein